MTAPKIGLPADQSRAFFASVIIVVVAVLLLLRGCAAVVSVVAVKEAKREAVCGASGMELVHPSVSHGKSSKAFYMCRDSAGLIHALPAEETP